MVSAARYHSQNAAMTTSQPRPRWPRWLLAGLGGLVLLLGVAYVGLNRAFPPERLAALLSEQVRSTTGRDFAVRGLLSIRLLPRIGIAADDVALGNAPWGTRKDMLTVRHARFDIALWPLLQGRVDIASVALDGPDLLLETDRNGAGNWVMGRTGEAGAPAEPVEPGGAPPRLRLSRLALQDARFAWRDGPSGTLRSVAVPRLELDAAGEGQQLSGSVDADAQRWQLQGRIGSLADLAANRADWPLDLQLRSDGAALALKGLLRHGAPPRTLDADLHASLTLAAVLAPWLKDATRVPLPLELKGQLHWAAPALRIDGLQWSLAQQQLNGTLQVQLGPTWKIDAQLAAQQIDLSRWLRPSATASATTSATASAAASAAVSAAPAASAPAAGRRVFGDTPLGLDALPAGPATLTLRVQRLLVPGLPPLSGLNLRLDASPGRLALAPLDFGIAGGQWRGSVVVHTAGGAPPRVALQAQASDLSLDALLQASGHAAYARGGKLQLRADLNMAGRTPHTLAAGASGELLLSLTDTTLGSGMSPLGTDVLRRVLQAVTLQPQAAVPTHIDCAVLRLPLKNGVAAVDRSIALQTAQLALSARGELRFDDETLTLAFRPTPKTGLGINPVNLAQLVVLKGPWTDPKLALDAQGVAGMAASLGLAGATGGLSMLVQQLLKAPAEKEVCRAALDGPAAAARPSPAPQPPGTLPLPQTLPDALRRIFKQRRRPGAAATGRAWRRPRPAARRRCAAPARRTARRPAARCAAPAPAPSA